MAAGVHPDVELLIVDVDATLVLAHNDAKQGGAAPYKHSFGYSSAAGLPGLWQGPG
jgi:hypothetical protein